MSFVVIQYKYLFFLVTGGWKLPLYLLPFSNFCSVNIMCVCFRGEHACYHFQYYESVDWHSKNHGVGYSQPVAKASLVTYICTDLWLIMVYNTVQCGCCFLSCGILSVENFHSIKGKHRLVCELYGFSTEWTGSLLLQEYRSMKSSNCYL